MMKSLRTFIQIHRSIKQHATRFSAVVVVLLFGLFLEAYMHDFNLVYITLFFVFSLAFSAGPLGVLNLGHLDAKVQPTSRLFAKQEGFVSLNVSNQSYTPSWAVQLYALESKVSLVKVDAQKSQNVKLPYTPPQRGKISLSSCTLESKFPLSTARLTKEIFLEHVLLIYPEPSGIPLCAFLAEQEAHYGEEKEFDGLVAYDGSQDLSRIHWASVAKGEMAVKRFSKETSIEDLIFHFNRLSGDDEARLSQLCLWVLACEKKHHHFKIHMPHNILDSSKESIDEILQYLAKY